MQKSMLTRGALLLVVTIFVCWGHSAAAPAPVGPNTAQVDRTSDWTCPTPSRTTGDWFTVDNLDASITTTGNPVLLSINLA